VPFEIILAEDVPLDPPTPALHFQAAKDYQVDGVAVIAKGAAVTGEVVLPAGKKSILRRGAKPMFRLIAADAVDGTKLKVKAAPGRSSDKNERNLEPTGHRGKDSLAPAEHLPGLFRRRSDGVGAGQEVDKGRSHQHKRISCAPKSIFSRILAGFVPSLPPGPALARRNMESG